MKAHKWCGQTGASFPCLPCKRMYATAMAAIKKAARIERLDAPWACKNCGSTERFTYFNYGRLIGWCKPCKYASTTAWKKKNGDKTSAHWKRYYKENKADIRANAKVWDLANADKRRLYSNNRRAIVNNALGSHTEAEWQAILTRASHRCAACRKKKILHRDHIVPVSKGGSNYALNIQPLCKSCNSSKRDCIEASVEFSLFDRVG